ncbi:hypothetical protein, partial [Neisseria mucosa]|uniref:hypothetical protein n=1 Tax=Neisseria mucosa TaxID=488 RepID=UPI0030B8F1CC
WIKFKSGQGDEAADSTDSAARQRRTGLKLIHYIRYPSNLIRKSSSKHAFRTPYSFRRGNVV